VLATLQHANFGRVYAAYGGIFIVMAVIWGWKIDQVKPDKCDLIGAGIALRECWSSCLHRENDVQGAVTYFF
jgi:drug/metabolite transporter superfamily protein YnfA